MDAEFDGRRIETLDPATGELLATVNDGADDVDVAVAAARSDIPKLLRLYRRGDLKLDELITRMHPLDDINTGYKDMREHRIIRSPLVFD